MRLNEVRFGQALAFEGYGPGFWRIGGRVIEGPVLARADTAVPWGGWDDRAPLLALAGEVDVIFLGTGAEIAHPPRDLIAALEEAGIGAEVMASPTAARSYNVLLADGRRIAAALLPVG